MAPIKLGTKGIGSLVTLRVNGTAREFIVVHHGKPSQIYDDSFQDGTWLLMKDIYENRQWSSSTTNDYANSAVHGYLNSSFLNLFDANVRNIIKQVKIPYRPGSGDDMGVSSGANGLSCKVFLLSCYEMGWTSSDVRFCPLDGAKLSYFEEGSGTSANNKRIGYLGGSAAYWWLRSPMNDVPDRHDRTYIVYLDGRHNNVGHPYSYGVRPALVMPSSAWILDDGTVATNQIPNTPPHISVPEGIKGGASTVISWGGASDPDGNLAGYKLERSVNGGGWGQIYQGAAASHTDSITYGWVNVAYRVRAYDSFGEHSGYTTSPTRQVINNSAPVPPSDITVPATVRGGKACVISWGASTDVDGNLAGYRLERSVNGGGYTQLYQGVNRSFTDTITRGWTSVAYRVRAYDSEGAASGYRDTPARTVLNNLAPSISGGDGNLGVLTAPFSASYTLSDDDGDPVNITERLDNAVLRSFAATPGTQYTATMDAAQWQRVLNGAHTLAVTAADNQGGSSVRTWTFTKAVHQMSITLTVPFAADAMPTRCIVNITGVIPTGAIQLVEVCNNGHDAQPTWEDCTASVKSGRKFFFANTAKTAAQWGFNFRAAVDRAGAVGDCFISGIGGNFE